MTAATTTRRARVAAGLCVVCLRRRRTPGHPTCRPCRVRSAERSAQLYAERRDAGLCTISSCEEPASGYLCEVHAEARRARRSGS